jgi:hypothetical protein
MTFNPDNHQVAPRRYGRCLRKQVWLTQPAIESVGNYARQQGHSFSAALERLARRGLASGRASVRKTDPYPAIARLTATYSDNIQTILTLARSETMHDLLETREERYGKTVRKHISLTPESVTAIEIYASQYDISFSAALESLALLGLGNRSAETLPRLLTGLLDSILNRYLGRYARLSSQAVMAAEEANTKADFLVLQTLWREARQDPDGFEEKLGVSLNPDVQPDRRVRELQQQVKDLAQTAAIERLRQNAESAAGGEQEGMTDG